MPPPTKRYPARNNVANAELYRRPQHSHLATWIGVIWSADPDRVSDGLDVGFRELAQEGHFMSFARSNATQRSKHVLYAWAATIIR
jgi:hypothetical protein